MSQPKVVLPLSIQLHSILKIKSIPARAPSVMSRLTGSFMILLVRDVSRMAVYFQKNL
jgi:hypothetical protein